MVLPRPHAVRAVVWAVGMLVPGGVVAGWEVDFRCQPAPRHPTMLHGIWGLDSVYGCPSAVMS